MPGAEQLSEIREIIEHDKVSCIFSEPQFNPDIIKAVDFDETMQLLHVGTSSGRSDFDGLQRINSTTTAVTTDISASNGLIVEQ